MRLYRIVMKSGLSVEVTAKLMVDDEQTSETLNFYLDDGAHQLVATIKRCDVAGLILLPPKSSANPGHR